jgi:type II secretory pathway pseudopilin PulG
MVVVLIMGILMAIGIPTFLSTRSSANNSSAESNAMNALINEKAYYSSNVDFVDLTNGAGSGSQAWKLDPTLPWSGTVAVTAPQVTAMAGTVNGSGVFQEAAAGGTGPALVVEAASSSGDCMYAADNEISSSAMLIVYAESDNSAGCAGTSLTFPSSAPSASAGVAGNHIETGTAITATDWYTSW